MVLCHSILLNWRVTPSSWVDFQNSLAVQEDSLSSLRIFGNPAQKATQHARKVCHMSFVDLYPLNISVWKSVAVFQTWTTVFYVSPSNPWKVFCWRRFRLVEWWCGIKTRELYIDHKPHIRQRCSEHASDLELFLIRNIQVNFCSCESVFVVFHMLFQLVS